MLTSILSWFGATLVLTAFALNIRKAISPDSLAYILLNLVGSLLLAVSAYFTQGYAFVFLNTVWLLFALVSLIKLNKEGK